MFSYWAKPEHTLDLARYLNDHIAQCVAQNPKRFVGKGSLALASLFLLALIHDPSLVQALGLCPCKRLTWPFQS